VYCTFAFRTLSSSTPTIVGVRQSQACELAWRAHRPHSRWSSKAVLRVGDRSVPSATALRFTVDLDVVRCRHTTSHVTRAARSSSSLGDAARHSRWTRRRCRRSEHRRQTIGHRVREAPLCVSHRLSVCTAVGRWLLDAWLVRLRVVHTLAIDAGASILPLASDERRSSA